MMAASTRLEDARTRPSRSVPIITQPRKGEGGKEGRREGGGGGGMDCVKEGRSDRVSDGGME